MSLEDTLADIRLAYRVRTFAMDQRKRIYLALGAYVRLTLGWQRDLPEKERAKIAKAAAECIDSDGEDSPLAPMILTTRKGAEAFEKAEKESVKALGKIAQELDVWHSFGKSIRGFGPVSLGVILAEAGDLSAYDKVSKLWKRMGLGIVGGIRQGGLSKGASADKWIEHGYNAKRRSAMWNIGDALIKGNQNGKYRTMYLRRKEYELARKPDMTPMHAHRRAQRYMEKKFLRDLWNAWRRASVVVPSQADALSPAATQRVAA